MRTETHAIVKNVSASTISLAELGSGVTLAPGAEIDFMDPDLPNGRYERPEEFNRALNECPASTLYQHYHADPVKITVRYEELPCPQDD
jgi:hypothetical protein